MTEARSAPGKRRWRRYVVAALVVVGVVGAGVAYNFDALKTRVMEFAIHRMVAKLPGGSPPPRGPESELSKVASPDFPGLTVALRDCDRNQTCPETRPISPDPHSIGGTWNVYVARMTVRPDEGARDDGLAPYTPAAEALVTYRVRVDHKGTPVPDSGVYCRPLNLVKQLAYPFLMQYLQTSDRIYQVFEEWQDVRTIFLNRPHPANLEPSYMGDSVGHWEGDTLVVDTIGFNDQGWLDMFGSPHGKQLHVTERIRKIDDGKSLEDMVTMEDPEFYTHPFTERIMDRWHVGSYIPEKVCEESVRAVISDGLLVQ